MPRWGQRRTHRWTVALLLLLLVCAPVVVAPILAQAQTLAPLPPPAPPKAAAVTSPAEPPQADQSWYSAAFQQPPQSGSTGSNTIFDERSVGACNSCSCDRSWQWQALPGSLMYQSYLAGAKESRFASVWSYDKYEGWIWDIALGGRVGLARFGTPGTENPEGWQLDIEGAGFPRLDLDNQEDLMAADFRFGAPLTYSQGPFETKLAIYHLSSHAGDEFLLSNPTFTRINYSRNALVWGQAVHVDADTRIYAEAEWAFDADVAEPWAFQFGVDYSPVRSGRKVSAPFAALNGHLREEVDFGGNFVAQAGWQWKARNQSRLFRAGLEYYVGKSNQFEFFNQDENKIGVGLWYDY